MNNLNDLTLEVLKVIKQSSEFSIARYTAKIESERLLLEGVNKAIDNKTPALMVTREDFVSANGFISGCFYIYKSFIVTTVSGEVKPGSVLTFPDGTTLNVISWDDVLYNVNKAIDNKTPALMVTRDDFSNMTFYFVYEGFDISMISGEVKPGSVLTFPDNTTLNVISWEDALYNVNKWVSNESS